ncbi:hypothetical protein Q5H93_05300 [Hymenobacter sp. ASUV-10]|uniref:Delta-60 repeat domain-containing protein n=1 Tax=Hymenobacter aranciens TaxID=3063996 RepID=A0ABT9B781_9BACT|nr:hypothetical protein [Hymenobacter sp. ASUV-10]MDO7874140.1 hypothetical protein [Hymenobacter sp. ASUV-10]
MMLPLPFRRRLAGLALLLTLLAPAAPAQVLDPTFRLQEPVRNFTSFNYITRAMAVQPDGRIVVSGAYDYLDGAITNTVRRLHADGTPDPSFRTQAGTGMIDNYATALAIQPGGKIIAVGQSMLYDGVLQGGIVRLNTDGTLDPSFNAGGDGFFTGVGAATCAAWPCSPTARCWWAAA